MVPQPEKTVRPGPRTPALGVPILQGGTQLGLHARVLGQHCHWLLNVNGERGCACIYEECIAFFIDFLQDVRGRGGG